MTDDNKSAEQFASDARAALEYNVEATLEFVKRQWRENPMAVVAAAAGAGFLLGLLLGRRK
jgi:ElaB/YqjD/DUF883 family membrane-anchored ribosome-binding protein